MHNQFINLPKFALISTILLSSGIVSAEINNCTPISTAPTTISAPGIYCLDQNISYSRYMESAIVINASNVTLDLNGHQIQGDHLGGVVAPASATTGIISSGNSNVIIRNGTVTGLRNGISISGGANNLIENMNVSDIVITGISLKSDHSIVQNNIVSGMDGNLTTNPQTIVLGIVIGGIGSQVLNNTVTGLKMAVTVPTRSAIGIYSYQADNARIEGNFIQGGTENNNDMGIVMVANFPANVMVVNNRLSALAAGVNYDLWGSPATGVYSGNMTSDVTTPYTGGIAHGLNF